MARSAPILKQQVTLSGGCSGTRWLREAECSFLAQIWALLFSSTDYLILLAIHKVQGFLAQLASGPCTCASVTGYCATQINGVVHSKYTEEKSADSFCEPGSGKKDCSGCYSLRSLAARESTG